MIRLIAAEDEWLAAERVHQLVAECGEGAEVVHVHADASGVPGLQDALFSASLFASERLVIVEGAERLQSAGAKRLAEVLSRAGGVDVICAAVSERAPAAVQKALQPLARTERLSRPKRGELVAWVGQQLRKAGVTAHKDVPGLLVEALGSGLRDLAQATDQLALRAGKGGSVAPADVRAAYPGLAEQPVWALYDALLAREGRKAYRVLHALFEQGSDPIAILFAIVGQNRHVMRAKGVLERTPGCNDSALASALAVSPGRAGVLRRQAAQVGWDWLVRLHQACAAADFDLKGGDEVRIVGLLPPEIILERLLDHALPAIEPSPG